MVDLFDLNETIRRVVAARVSDSSTIEDLTQETFVRVAAVERRLTGDALLAYAIVTARNLTVSHARTRAMHDRNAHRLVDYTDLDGPETLTLQRDETDALAAALATLDPDARDLLLRHEVDGVTTAELADEHGTTAGGIAMRLARARAHLRLEFVLAFRRTDLPTDRCRPILLAFSAGDRRRQHALDAAPHLATCSVCAELVEPVTRRQRAIAAWLIGPFAALVGSVRSRRTTQIAVGTVVIVGAVFATTVVATNLRDGSDDSTVVTADLGRSVGEGGDADPNASPSAELVRTSGQSETSAGTAISVTVPSVVTVAPACPDDPLAEPSRQAADCTISDVALTVTDLTGDETFSAKSASGTIVWVCLIGRGESPVTVRRDDVVTLARATIVGDMSLAGFGTAPRSTDLVITADYADVHTP
ncbi:MAG: sigma-70 family RNA polymerase sigma factor [Ilumatobacteraceae bacterium]